MLNPFRRGRWLHAIRSSETPEEGELVEALCGETVDFRDGPPWPRRACPACLTELVEELADANRFLDELETLVEDALNRLASVHEAIAGNGPLRAYVEQLVDRDRAAKCTCGQAEAERAGHAPEHESWCELGEES